MNRKKISDYSKVLLDSLPSPKRVMAPFLWFGGKGMLARKIVSRLPQGKIYVEPYCGAASVFWYIDPPREVEVLNDINNEIINLFRTLQDKQMFDKLVRRLCWTPYSVSEFVKALKMDSDDPVDNAWAFFVKQGQCFSGQSKGRGSWGRAFISRQGMAKTAASWRRRLSQLRYFHERLTRVQLDNSDVFKVIKYWDSNDTVFYIDPPYLASTRKSNSNYEHEVSEDHHRELINLILNVTGKVAISGYDNRIYCALEDAGWEKHIFKTACHAAGKTRMSKLQGRGAILRHQPRTECLWVKD